MIKSILIRTCVSISLAASFPSVSFASTVNAEALELAGEKRFNQALLLLSRQDAGIQSSYEHRFLKARILSWAGKYPEAENELNRLMIDYPGNPDVELAAGNLQYYQGEFLAAENYYLTVLSKFPNYEDAQRGLDNVRKAKSVASNVPNQKWRIDGSLSLSSFDQDNLSDWNNQFLRAEYTPDQLAYHGSIQRYKRFGKTDIEFRVGLSDAVRGGWDWGLEAGFASDAVFRPDLSLGGRLGRSLETFSGIVLYPSVNYRFDDYESGTIHNLSPELTAYLNKGLVLTARLIGTLQEGERDQLGWLIQSRKRISDRVQINGGYANAPEAVNGIAISTKSFFSGLTYTVRDDFDVHLNLVRDDREDSYIRKGVNVGFTHKH